MQPLDQVEPVDTSEDVYRRVNVCYYDASLPLAVLPDAFKPTDRDVDGISVTRVRFTSAPTDALVDVQANRINLYHISKIPVAEFLKADLPVVADPIPNNPGHALVPGLRKGAYEDRSQKKLLKDKMMQLAEIASRAIVHSPPADEIT